MNIGVGKFAFLTKIVMYLEMVLGRPVVTMDYK